MKKLFVFTTAILTTISSHAQWQPDVRLTIDPEISATSVNNARCVAAQGDTIHVVWFDYRDADYEIYYKRSTDGGLSWGADTRLTYHTGYSHYPSVCVSGSNVHVVWYDDRDTNYEVYYKRSTDAGVTWEADHRLTYDISTSEYPCVAVSGSAVHVVWYDFRDGDREIYYKGSADNGTTWGTDTRVSLGGVNALFPSVAAFGQYVHVVWYDARNGNPEIYYQRSTDGGLNWGTDTRLTNQGQGSISTSVAAWDQLVHVVWYDDRDTNPEIYYKRSIDGGQTWEPDVRLTYDISHSYDPSVAAGGNAVHVVWTDDRDFINQLYYKFSSDGGVTWGPDTRLTYTNLVGLSLSPSVVISGQRVNTVWRDNRDGNWEVYYKQEPTGNLVGTEYSAINNSGQICVYPNPVSAALHIRLNNFSKLPAGYTDDRTLLTVQNILGEELLIKIFHDAETIVDVSGLPEGFYFLKVSVDAKEVDRTKFIISR